MCWMRLPVEHRRTLSVVLVYLQIVPLGIWPRCVLSCLQHTGPLRFIIIAVSPESPFSARRLESYLVLTLLLNYVAMCVSMDSAAEIHAGM